MHGVAPGGMSYIGSIVQVVGPPVTTAVEGLMTYGVLPVAQLTRNHDPVSVTGSLNVTVRLTFEGCAVAPSTGTVATTVGAPSVESW